MHSKKNKHKKRIIAEPLEPRLLFSASADMVLLDDVLPDLDLGTQAAELNLLDVFDLPSAEHSLIDPDIAADFTPPAREAFAGEIIVVDGSLTENEALIENIQSNSPDRDFEVFTLDPERDGIEQISLLLANYSGVKSVHLLSHGSEARLKLGNTRLDEQTVDDRSDELASWKDALSDDADLMIYGCDVAANDAGVALLNRIAQITEADVAASNDDTGTQILGGDWQLEQQIGQIETQTLAAPSWNGLMAATAIDDSVTIWFDETLQGNVLTGVGGSGINADSFDTGPGMLLSVTYNGVVYNAFDGSGNLTIDADQGTVVFNQDGTYTYTTSFSALTVSGDTVPSWSAEFNLFGYSAGTSYLDGSNLLDTGLSDTTVFEEFNGLGIIGGDSYELDNADGNSEAIVVDAKAEYGQAKIVTSTLSATETLQWEAFSSAGALVGSGTVNGIAGGGAADYQTQVIDVASDFQYLVFTVPNAGEALYIHEISLGANIPADEVFSYVVDDAGTGGTDTGLLTISFADDNLGQASSFVTGVFDEGETLTTDFIIAEPDGVSGTINYQWQRSVDGENWTAITGETADSYTLTSADAGYYVGVNYSYFDDEGTLETFDSQYSPPRIDSADGSGRLLIAGNEAEGQLLNAIVHDPDGANGTIDYQWQRSSDGLSWSDITDATSADYTLATADLNQYVRVTASYIDDGGNPENLTSPSTGLIGNNDIGVISVSGTFTEYETLSTAISDADGVSGLVSYQWQRSDDGITWSDITGAIASSYTLVGADVNNYVRVTATYVDGGGHTELPVSATGSLVTGVNDGSGITLSGTEAENEVLTATITDPDAGTPSAITYAWERSTDGGSTWSTITGATSATYTLTDQDSNNLVRVVADYTDGEGNLETNVIDTSGVVGSVNDGSGVTLSGIEAENEVLTATITDPDAGTSSAITYAWERSTDGGTTWSTITGATSATYTLTDQDSNNLVRVVADYTDGEGNLETNVIDTTGVIGSVNDGSGITLSGIEAENEVLTATITDPDAGTPSAITYIWERSTDGGSTWSTITGATSATYTLTDQDSNNLVRVVADYTDGEGNLETNVIDTSGVIGSVNDGSGITLSGIEAENEILTATINDPDAGTPSAITYIWERSTDGGTTWSTITGATSATYTLTDLDSNNLVRVVADYTDGEGNLETNVIDTTGVIGSVNDGSGITLSGIEAENEVLTATITDPDAGTPSAITYAWERSTDGGSTWSTITGATSATYTLTDQDSNNLVRVVADYTDGEGNLETNVIDTSGVISSVNDGSGVTLSGIEAENEILTATITDPDAGTPSAITYIWERSTDGGTTWSTITGATNATYTLTNQDSNNLVRVVADYTDGEGNVETNVTATSGVIAPVNDSSSLTLSGTAEENQSLSATLVDTDGVSGTVTYTWQRSADGVSGWSDISGATTASYTLVDADVGQYLRAVAAYTDDQGFVENVSSASSAQVNGINDPGAVTLTGTAAEDQTLTANVTDLDGISGTINYSWQRSADGTSGWTTIATATNASYTLDDIDTGTYLRVQVNYTDDQGFAEALTSPASAQVSASNDPASLNLSGTAAENAVLTANLSDADGISGTVTYTWQRSADGLNWNTISGNSSASYTLSDADTGNFIRVTADYTDDQGFIESVTSPSSAPVVAENDPGTISLTGIAAENEILTASVADADGISGAISYSWERSSDGSGNWNTIAAGESYTLGDADVDNFLRVVASYTDDQNFNETLTSSISGPVSAVNDAPTLTISGNNQQNQTLTANLNDADGFDAGSVLYQWERSSNGVDWQLISGANSATYTLAQVDVDNSLRVSASYTDNQGFNENPSVSVGPISDVNDAPELQIVVLDQLATEDERFEFTLASNTFTDPDGDSLSYRAQLLGGGALPAWLSFDATTLQFTGTANRNDIGTVSIEIIAEDGRGGMASTSFDLTVNGINDSPTTTGLADILVNEDAPTSVVNLIASFNDEESGAQNLRFSVQGNTNPGLFSQVEIDSDGSLYLSYAQDQWGTAVITLRATDQGGAFVESPLTVFVSPVNDQPTTSGFNPLQFISGEREQNQIDLSTGFNDVEDGRDLSYSVVGNSNSDLVTVAAVDDNGRLILNYSAPGSGNANIVLRATDSDGAFVETTLLVQITPQPITELPQQPETPEPEEPETEPENTPVDSSDEPQEESPASDAPANNSDDLVRSNGDGTAGNNDYREFLTLAENTRSRPAEYDIPITYASARHESPAKIREVREETGGDPTDNREIASLVALPGGYLSEQDISDFNEELHKLKMAMDEAIEEQKSSNAIYQGLTISLTTGLAVWVLRASSLFLTLFSMIPIWRGLDPMPVVHAQVRRLEKIRQQKDKQEEDKQAKEVGYLFDKEAS